MYLLLSHVNCIELDKARQYGYLRSSASLTLDLLDATVSKAGYTHSVTLYLLLSHGNSVLTGLPHDHTKLRMHKTRLVSNQ